MLLPAERRTRLIKLLGMLGSAHDGERANAGRMAHELVMQAGLTWETIVSACSASPAPWQTLAAQVLACRCTDWERGFCESLLDSWRGPTLTAKQQQVLNRIYAQRVERHRA
jgi:hypothetical protein